MLDTMGVFWTMKYPNEKDAQLLEQWNLKPKGLEKIKVFTPIGLYEYSKSIGIPTDAPFSIKASELSGEDWRLAFELSTSHPVSILIEKILGDLAEKKIEDFDIDEIIQLIEEDKTFSNDTKNEAVNRFKASKNWGLFSNEGTKIEVLINRGAVSILDMSAYATSAGGWGIKALVVGLIAKKVFVERMLSRKIEEIESIRTGYSYFKIKEEINEEKKPLVWFVLDESHELLPREGKTAATDALVTILREGRQPGISLLLITQQPGKIHSDVLTQSDIVLAHRLTAKLDVEAFNSMMQSYLGDTLTSYLNILPADSGAAIILDDNSERLYPIQVRPKVSWHGGESPTAIKFERSQNLGI
jgi:DNA helicase HerA-like ATPase